ncbi:NEUR [Mytilus coruscus]|uniref:NEUR n=1 Tax=Mytilus coruscus TaxID=42192 RepID=A0A6J8DEE2_MYTCO|nr:NEUR [Mytilus coruscus]
MGFIEQARASKRKCSNLPGTSAQKVPKPENVKLGIGWQHYSYNTAGYHQVRSSRNKQIPSHDIVLTIDKDYDGTVKVLQDIFFKNGRNFKGRLSEMESRIGNSAGREISRDGFTAKKYFETCQTQKKRIYLLTKTKAQHITSLDFSITSDSDESLPDLGSQFSENLLSSTLPAISTVTCSTPSASQFTAHLTSPSFPAASTPITQTSSTSNILVHAGTPTVTIQIPNTARKCIICTDREIDAVIQPCFHSLCLVCGLQIEEHGKKCPICRGQIESVRSIYYC